MLFRVLGETQQSSCYNGSVVCINAPHHQGSGCESGFKLCVSSLSVSPGFFLHLPVSLMPLVLEHVPAAERHSLQGALCLMSHVS